MATDAPTQNYSAIEDSSKWTTRPALARLVRLTVLLLPILGSFLVTWIASSRFPPEQVGIHKVLWWVIVLIVATFVMFAIERVARRGLPLVALLKMNLVFPEEAPSRFGTALRTGTTKQLERRIEEMRLLGLHDSEEVTYGQQMLELIAALNAHDRLTRGHCERVRAYTDLLIEELKIDDEDANKLRWSALLHDVGKIMVPAAIINKEGRPTADEWTILKSHAAEGQRIVEPIAGWLGEWSRSVGEHHERWDGDGYPNGFAANEIHLGARIVAVADAFDVMTSARSYKKPMPTEAAREEVARCSGSQFDPEVVRAFLNIGIGRLRLAMGPLTWLANIPSAGQIPIAPVATPVANVVASTVGVTAALVTGGAGVLFPEDVSVPEPAVAFVDEEPLAITIPPTTLGPPVATIPVAPATSTPVTTTTTSTTTSTTTTTLAPAVVPSPTNAAPTATTTTTTTTPPTTTPIPTPLGNDSSVNINEDQSATLSLSGVVGSGAPSFDISVAPQHGTIAKVAGGTVVGSAGEELWEYVPNGDFNGDDSFVYRICDERGICDVAVVEITIAPVNDAPMPVADELSTVEDTPLIVPIADLLANDVDVDDVLELVSFSQPASGSVTTDSAGNLVYVPSPGSDGIDSFTYTVTDGTQTGVQNVTVVVAAVPDSPTATDDTFGTDEDTPVVVQVAALLGNDSDPDPNDAISFDSYTQPINGAISTGITGDLVYTPDANFNGTDTFTYTITDGALTDTATVNISVSSINDRPEGFDDSGFTIPQRSTLSIPVTTLISNDFDVENNPLSIGAVNDVFTDGQATLAPDGLTISFVSEPEFAGNTTFKYTVCDSAGLCDLGPTYVTINVTDVNDAPTGINDTLPNTPEDQAIVFTEAFIVSNDLDPDLVHSTESLSATIAASSANGGAIFANAAGDFVYQPVPDFHGVDTFSYIVTDAAGLAASPAKITITVTPVGEAPVANDDPAGGLSFAVEVDSTTTLPEIRSNDTDDDDVPTSLTMVIPGSSSAGAPLSLDANGLVVYQAVAGFDGIDTFSYLLTDSDGLISPSAVVSIDVQNTVNDAPTGNPDAYTVAEDSAIVINYSGTNGLLANDTDPDAPYGDQLFVVSIQPPATDGSIVIDPATATVTFTPPPNFNGQSTFTYEACDSSGSACTGQIAVTVTVTDEPDNPIAVDDFYVLGGRWDVPQGTAITVPISDLRANDTNPDDLTNANGAAMTYTLVSATTAAGTPVTQSSVDSDIVISPNQTFDGTDTFTYQVCNLSGLCDTATVTVLLSDVNHSPELRLTSPHDVTSAFTGAEDTDWTDIIPSVIDPLDAQTGDTHTWSIGSGTLPNGLTLDPSSGTISGRPAIGSSGDYSVTVVVTDDSTVTPGPLSDQTTLNFEIVDWELSELVGDWMISEVRYRESALDAVGTMEESWDNGSASSIGELDEFIEIVNVSGGPLDLSNLTLTDINAKELDTGGNPITDKLVVNDPNSGTYVTFDSHFTHQMPSVTVNSGDHVVLWLNGSGRVVEINDPTTNTIVYSFEIETSQVRPTSHWSCLCVTAPLLGNSADEVFLIDAAGRVVDFVAWDDATTFGNEKSKYPVELDPSIQPIITAAPAPGQSISNANYDRPPGTVFSLSSCWELTTGGTAFCPGAVLTESAGAASAPAESYGQPNYPGAP